MRVNVYAEEMTGLVEVVEKNGFTGIRFPLQLPSTVETLRADGMGAISYRPANVNSDCLLQVQAPFIHKKGDDDSSAVTFWGKRYLRDVLVKALQALDAHHASHIAGSGEVTERMSANASHKSQPNPQPVPTDREESDRDYVVKRLGEIVAGLAGMQGYASDDEGNVTLPRAGMALLVETLSDLLTILEG